MKVLVVGAKGQLGMALQEVLSGCEVEFHDKDTLDLASFGEVAKKFRDFKPDVVVNAAAYTAVDKAEEESVLANKVNHEVVRNLAEECSNVGSKLVQVSTDFVFDGLKGNPYRVDDQCNPLSVYGQTKRDAEIAIQEILPDNHVIVRTAWLYSQNGNNFVKTMLRLMSEREELRVVSDQIGTPTSAPSLAELINLVLGSGKGNGLYHWTDAGVASWYDFAVAIYEEAMAMGLLDKRVLIIPINASQYPTPAKRPAFSVLDKTKTYEEFKIQPVHWRQELRNVLRAIADQDQN